MEWLSPDNKKRIKRTSLRQELRDYIVSAIFSGALKAGEQIVETHLARHFGVSQAPVREALRELEQIGLVENEQFRGTFVRSFSPQELQDIYAVRAVLEGFAAQHAMARMSKQDFARLDATFDAMVAAAQAGDQQTFVSLDVAFHHTIVELSGNSFLNRVWNMIQPANWTLLTARTAHFRLDYLAERHHELLVALRSGDPALASKVAHQHIMDLAPAVNADADAQTLPTP